MQPREVTPLSEGFAPPVAASRSNPSAHDALVPALADGASVAPYRRRCKRSTLVANDPRALRSAVRELQGRVYAELNKGPHARKLQTWANVVKAAGRLDPWCLAPSILYDTSAALWKAGYRSLDGYLSAVKQELILNHGSLPGILTFISGESRVR